MPAYWQQILVVGAGGFIGAIARFVISGEVARWFPNFPAAGTLAVNVLGCLLIGALGVWIEHRELSPLVRGLLAMGVLGSLTTFSTFGYETIELLHAERPRAALFNVAANLLIGFAAVVLGMWLARRMTA